MPNRFGVAEASRWTVWEGGSGGQLGTQVVAADMAGRQDSLIKRFFALSSDADLARFSGDLETADPLSAALAFQIDSWAPILKAGQEGPFNPRRFVTDDLSAAMLGSCPVIFMGTNAWATKPYLSVEAHIKKAEVYKNHLKKLLAVFAGKKIVLAVIPEKDYIIESQFMKTGRFGSLDTAMQRLADSCISSGCDFVFNEYFDPLKAYDKIDDFEYFDTHLPAKYYIQVFSKILKGFGSSWQEVAHEFSFVDDQFHGDLATKFSAREPLWKYQLVAEAKTAQCNIVEGTPSFAEPLGSTWQKITNARPLKSGKVLVLGDSHSSILAQHRLTYLLASTFEHCEFRWNPFGVREMPVATDADMVVLEISQRFLF